jgi:2Fe-2S ferredoxin
MLNFSAGLQETSRLGCQVTVTDALDGIVVKLPEGQH